MVSAVDPSSPVAAALPGDGLASGAAASHTFKCQTSNQVNRLTPNRIPHRLFMKPPEWCGPGRGGFSGPMDGTAVQQRLAGKVWPRPSPSPENKKWWELRHLHHYPATTRKILECPTALAADA